MTDSPPAKPRWRLIRVLAVILGSALFFPVSCITATVIGTQTFAELDARDLSAGDAPHDLFHILVRRPADSNTSAGTISVLTLDELKDLPQDGSNYTLLMPESSGSFEDAQSGGRVVRVRYRAEPQPDGAQRIVVYWADDDYSATSVYIATARSTKLLSSRIYAPGYAFKAMPWGIGVAFVVWLLGKWLMRRTARRESPATA